MEGAAEAILIWLDCPWGCKQGKRAAFSRKNNLPDMSPLLLHPTSYKAPLSESSIRPDTGNTQLSSPALFCTASTGGSAQAQSGLVTVRAGQAEFLGVNALRAAQPVHVTWMGKLLWAMPTAEWFC